MKNTEIVKRILEFLHAENQRDWLNYEKFLSHNVQWTFFSIEGTRVVNGRENYVNTMKRIYENLDSTFNIISLLSNDELGIVMAELEMDNRRSVDVFELRDGLILREREYYDGVYWYNQLMQKQSVSMTIELEEKFLETIKKITYLLSAVENWAIDGSASLALQGIDLKPHDIDILTDGKNAYKIQTILSEFMEKPVRHTSNGKYDSHFGLAIINGINVEIMGDLRVFRNGHWSGLQNPTDCKVKVINLQGAQVPVVSLDSQVSTGYLQERIRKKFNDLDQTPNEKSDNENRLT